MPDISMCQGSNSLGQDCPVKETCYRFKAKPCEYRQCYLLTDEELTEKGCANYWGIESE